MSGTSQLKKAQVLSNLHLDFSHEDPWSLFCLTYYKKKRSTIDSEIIGCIYYCQLLNVDDNASFIFADFIKA